MAADMFRLDGKTVAVVGAGSGIGESVALAAAAQGAHVACFDLSAASAASVAERITTAGGSAESGVMDLGDDAQIEAGLSGLAERRGKLDGLVCTPAINVRKPILKYSLARVRQGGQPEPARQLRRVDGVGQDHDRAEVGQHRALLLDPLDRHRARAVGLFDDQGRHPAAGEDRGGGVGHAGRSGERGRARRRGDAVDRTDQGAMPSGTRPTR